MATENDSVSTDAIGTLVVVLAVAVVAVGLAVTAMVRSEQSALDAVRETQANLRPLRELRASQLAELTSTPAWVNRDKGIVTIPIDRAMELVLQQARSARTDPPSIADSGSGVTPPPIATAPTPVESKDSGSRVPAIASASGAKPPEADHGH